ncbi:hypothetical protein ACFQV8_39065 [Pseudonocardia benzenivorans]
MLELGAESASYPTIQVPSALLSAGGVPSAAVNCAGSIWCHVFGTFR